MHNGRRLEGSEVEFLSSIILKLDPAVGPLPCHIEAIRIFPNDPLDFSLTPAEVPVTLDGKPYLLCETTGEAYRSWRNATMRGTRMSGSDVVVGLEDRLSQRAGAEIADVGHGKCNRRREWS